MANRPRNFKFSLVYPTSRFDDNGVDLPKTQLKLCQVILVSSSLDKRSFGRISLPGQHVLVLFSAIHLCQSIFMLRLKLHASRKLKAENRKPNPKVKRMKEISTHTSYNKRQKLKGNINSGSLGKGRRIVKRQSIKGNNKGTHFVMAQREREKANGLKALGALNCK